MKKNKKRYKTQIKFLSKEEIDRLTAEGMTSRRKDGRDYVLMQVLFCTGLRVSECVALQRKDFERDDVDETRELAIIGKGGWQRPIFFSPEVLKSIAIYLHCRKDNDARLFPITKRTAERIVKKYADKVGLHATPHTFRHSLATHLLKNGANIRVVQEMLGHRALSSTMCYTGVTNRDLLEVHKKLI
jgi:integrase/recombinase XerD